MQSVPDNQDVVMSWEGRGERGGGGVIIRKTEKIP